MDYPTKKNFNPHQQFLRLEPTNKQTFQHYDIRIVVLLDNDPIGRKFLGGLKSKIASRPN